MGYYDEKKFKTKANIKARRLWLVFALLLTVNYGLDTANGAYSIRNFIIFAVLCWLPFVCGDLLLGIREKMMTGTGWHLLSVMGFSTLFSCVRQHRRSHSATYFL